MVDYYPYIFEISLLNHAINMFMYGLTGSKFREEARTVLSKLRCCLTDVFQTSNNGASPSVIDSATRPTANKRADSDVSSASNNNIISTV